MSKINIDFGKIKDPRLVVLILLSLIGWALIAHLYNINTLQFNASMQVDFEELVLRLGSVEKALEQTLNSSFYGLQKPCSYMISEVGSYTCMQNGTTGKLDSYNTNAATVIQAALSNGVKTFIKAGSYDLSTTSLVIDAHGKVIEGEGRDLDGSGGTTLLYSGTGTAIQVYKSGIRLQEVKIKHLNVLAQGSAITSRTARGIWLFNVEDALIEDVTVKDFENGTGITVFCDSTSYTAQVIIQNSFLHANKWGIYCDGDSGGHAVNTVHILATAVIGKTPLPVGSAGITFDEFTDGCLVFGGDVEIYKTAFNIDGDYNSFIKTRTESIDTTHFYLASNGKDNTIINHIFVGGGTKVNNQATNTVIKLCNNYVTEDSGTSEASNDDWIAHELAGTPTVVTLTIEETDANYCLQLKASNSTHFQIYLYDLTASTLETVDKTINWYVEYKP